MHRFGRTGETRASLPPGLDFRAEPRHSSPMSRPLPAPTPPPRARRSPVTPEACSLARAIDLIGERWTLLILRAALFGVRRFDDFQKELGCPRTVLSNRLGRLAEAGLMDRQPYREPGKRTRTEYVLTARGQALQPTLIQLTLWGDGMLADGPAPLRFRDRDSRQILRAALVDEAGREVPAERVRTAIRSASLARVTRPEKANTP